MRTLTVAIFAMMIFSLHTEVSTAKDHLIAYFEENTYGDWKSTGTVFGSGSVKDSLPKQMTVSNFRGKRLVNSFFNSDKSIGELTSPPFQIDRHYLSFLIGGGNLPGETGIQLIIDGKVVRIHHLKSAWYKRQLKPQN